jgi:PAS domain S-box-containing protein
MASLLAGPGSGALDCTSGGDLIGHAGADMRTDTYQRRMARRFAARPHRFAARPHRHDEESGSGDGRQRRREPGSGTPMFVLLAWLKGSTKHPVFMSRGGYGLVRSRERAQAGHGALAGAGDALRRLADSGVIAVAAGTRDKITEANGAFLRLIGCSRADLAAGGIDWQAITPPEWAAADQAAMAGREATGSCVRFRKEYWRTDGSRVPVEISAVELGRKPLRWAWLVRDMSAEQRAEAAAQRIGELAALTAALAQAATVTEVARALTTHLRHAVGANLATIIEAVPRRAVLRFVALQGVPPEVFSQWAEFDASLDSPAVRPGPAAVPGDRRGLRGAVAGGRTAVRHRVLRRSPAAAQPASHNDRGNVTAQDVRAGIKSAQVKARGFSRHAYRRISCTGRRPAQVTERDLISGPTRGQIAESAVAVVSTVDDGPGAQNIQFGHTACPESAVNLSAAAAASHPGQSQPVRAGRLSRLGSSPRRSAAAPPP